MKAKEKLNSGITLVALVITIIILLILAGITISSLTNTGLFGKAKEAKEKTQEAEKNQAKILDEYETALNQYDEKTFVYKVNSGEIKVGDYVSYTPDTVSTDAILQELGTYSGSDANTTSTLTQEKDLKWRVLDVQNGQVRLISEVPTISTISLSGAKGYNNAVYLLDKTCKTLYNNSNLASNVQNLKIEDVQKYLTYDYKQFENSEVDTGKYGGTKEYVTNKNYPNIFAREKTGWVDGTQGTELGLSEQTQPIDETSTQAETSIKVTETFWNKVMTSDDFTNSKYYELFINNGSNNLTYWMSSRCVLPISGVTDFRVRNVDAGAISANYLCNSIGRDFPFNHAFRPIVTLNSNVQIDTANSGDGSTAEHAYIIK